jgi:hypothetical protein
MKRITTISAIAIIFAIALVFSSTQSVNAGHHGCSMFTAGVADMDSNSDGTISFDEYASYYSQQLRWSFDAIDADNDGFISNSEWELFLKMHGFSKNYERKNNG